MLDIVQSAIIFITLFTYRILVQDILPSAIIVIALLVFRILVLIYERYRTKCDNSYCTIWVQDLQNAIIVIALFAQDFLNLRGTNEIPQQKKVNFQDKTPLKWTCIQYNHLG
jgi:hypothetical protein